MKKLISIFSILLFSNLISSEIDGLSLLERQKAQRLRCSENSWMQNYAQESKALKALKDVQTYAYENIKRTITIYDKNIPASFNDYIQSLEEVFTGNTTRKVITKDISYNIFRGFILIENFRRAFLEKLIYQYKNTYLVIDHLELLKKECETILNEQNIPPEEINKYDIIKLFVEEKLKELKPQLLLENETNPYLQNLQTESRLARPKATHASSNISSFLNECESKSSKLEAKTQTPEVKYYSTEKIIKQLENIISIPEKITFINQALTMHRKLLSVTQINQLGSIILNLRIQIISDATRRIRARKELTNLGS